VDRLFSPNERVNTRDSKRALGIGERIGFIVVHGRGRAIVGCASGDKKWADRRTQRQGAHRGHTST